MHSNKTTTTPKERQQKGRSREFIDKRNMLLFYRWYFITTSIPGLTFDAIVTLLVEEFMISSYTIKGVFWGSDVMTKVRAEAPTKATLKKMYPHLNWNVQDLTKRIINN